MSGVLLPSLGFIVSGLVFFSRYSTHTQNAKGHRSKGAAVMIDLVNLVVVGGGPVHSGVESPVWTLASGLIVGEIDVRDGSGSLKP
jgi:hypothetical protein